MAFCGWHRVYQYMKVEQFPQLFLIVENGLLKNLHYKNQKKSLKQLAAVVKAGGKDITEAGILLFPASGFSEIFTQRLHKLSKFVKRLFQTITHNSPGFGCVLLLLNLLFLKAAWSFSGTATELLKNYLNSDNYVPKLDSLPYALTCPLALIGLRLINNNNKWTSCRHRSAWSS